MTTRSYTDDDLRAEAARQHRDLIEDPDFMGIGEQMEDTLIDSTVVEPDHDDTGTTWDELDDDDYDAAQRTIDELLRGAADTSDWAINLGADKLQPGRQYIDVSEGAGRLHIAFRSDLSDEQRTEFARNIAAILGEQIVDGL